MEVTLQQMLEAREARAFRQFQLNREYQRPLISFSMNIPGPVKNSPLIARGFRSGCEKLEAALPILRQEKAEAVTGCEAIYVVDMTAQEAKAITTKIEDIHPLGRLFDMDVLDESLNKLDRDVVGGGDRNCIVCGAPGRGCASRRVHSVAELQTATKSILRQYFAKADAERIGALAVRSLLDEVETTPKPGLVDRRNSGSHRDMDIHTFRLSAAALKSYFRDCVRIGMDTAEESPAETFRQLRAAGLQAEQVMYEATKGVNTHKGAIFTLGILCGAAGRLWDPAVKWEEAAFFPEISAMTRDAMEADWKKGGNTVGYRLYAQNGIRGIRGEAADGLPSVEKIGLPVYRACLERGMDPNEAGVRTLLNLIARVEDTNMIARGGLDGAKEGREAVCRLLEGEYTFKDVEELDDWFIQRRLSPGGCADLLACVYFLFGLKNETK